IKVRRLLRSDGLQYKRRLSNCPKCSAEVERRPRVTGCMNEQHPLRIRPSYHENTRIILRKSTSACEPNFTAVKSVAYVNWREFHRGPPARRHVHFARCGGFS